jgi:hypothetical protein
MSLHQLADIEALIQKAKALDFENDKLTKVLETRAEHLHNAIKLPAEKSIQALRAFVIRYIERVPEFISAIDHISREAGIDEPVTPLLNIACDYFLSPPDLINGRSQLEALLDEAYLAHRLLEEVNDRFIGYSGIPLAPMDSTRANVIAHELIGEPFANELDQAVLFSAELLLNEYSFKSENFQRYIALHKDRGWSEELRRWPCLEEDLDIDIRFEE